MRIERRTFLRYPAVIAGAAVFGLWREVLADPSTKLGFDDYVARVGALAKAALADPARNEDVYLHDVASLAARIDRVPDAKLGDPFKGVMRTGINYRGSGIVIVQWSMDPGLVYPAHDHPNYNAITLGIEGECRIRNFTPVGDPPGRGTKERFQVRETLDQILVPGGVASMMSTRRNNIHTLRTFGRGVRGIDVLTLLGDHVGFSFLEIDEATRRGDGTYDAAWGEHLGK